MQRRFLPAIFTLPVAALIAAAAPSIAHSTKEGTTPLHGAVLAAAPETIGMTFDTPMRVTMVRLSDADGSEYDVVRTDGMAPVTVFEAVPPALEPGAYMVEWRGLSDDGHAMEGSFSFEIGN